MYRSKVVEPVYLKVFISSRDDLKDIRATAEKAVDDMLLIPVMADTFHQPPSTDPQLWLRKVEDSDIAVLIVDEKDSQYVREEIEHCISRGKKVLMLRKEKAPRDEKLQEFIEYMQEHVFVSDFENCVELGDKIQRGLLAELANRYRETPLVIEGRPQSYGYATSLIKKTRDRLFLVTRTLPLITPP
jgi:vacuolar-type H+-ATPase subunit F/Vma7